jgi:VCBS repeat-containing protein
MYIMFNRRSLIAIVLASSALAGGNAFAQGQATVGIQTTTHYSIDGRIAAVDTNARTLTITSADGTQRMLNVSPMAANITSTKVGDNVVAGIEDTRSFVLSSPGVKTPAPGAAAVAGAVETSQGGVAGARVSNSIANWVVVSVNPAGNTITLVNPSGGEVRTYDVTTDAGRQQLPRVKQGDSLTEINSRVVVASITPKS